MCGDFVKACENAKEGDFVFFDSPYYDTFDGYQAGGFSKADHFRLFEMFKTLSDKGVYCMMTNNNCDFIKNLYQDFNIKIIDVKRMINCDGKNRVGKEVIVTNTIPLKDTVIPDKIKQVSVAPLLGEAISRIHDDKSVSSLFGFEIEYKKD